MGYEIRLMIGKRYEQGDKIKFYFGKYASIEIGGGFSTEMQKLLVKVNKKNSRKYSNTFFYNADKLVKVDRCGSKLRLVPAEEVLKSMIANYKEDPYKMLGVAIPLLENMIKAFNCEKLYCVLYGH